MRRTLSVDEIQAAAEREPGPSRADEIAAMTAAEQRRGLASKLRVLGGSRVEERRALWPRPLSHRNRRAPGRRPVRCRGSRRSGSGSRAGPDDPDPDADGDHDLRDLDHPPTWRPTAGVAS